MTSFVACRNVLRMVSELHVRGYQKLRIAPGMSPSGTSWRCAITPASNISAEHGAQFLSWEHLTAHYTSGQERCYFGWQDARYATPNQLAELFIKRFPEIALEARGSDWAYAGWYLEMLNLTYPDRLPIAYADYGNFSNHVATIGGTDSIQRAIPLPPPGPNGVTQATQNEPAEPEYGSDFFIAPPFSIGPREPFYEGVRDLCEKDRSFAERMQSRIEAYKPVIDDLTDWGFSFVWRPRTEEGRGWVYANLPRPQSNEVYGMGYQAMLRTELEFRAWVSGVVAGRDSVTGDYDDEPFGWVEAGLSPSLGEQDSTGDAQG